MFYRLIENKRNEWLESEDCTVRDLLQYIVQRDFMRDAQYEAIKTYLYLKIACDNKPLWELFKDGVFNSLDISKLELTDSTRRVLESNKAAAALLEYSRLKDKDGNQLAPALEQYIKHNATSIDFAGSFKNIFYGVSYPDYLFSLPMGAGKTYLMAAFIYLDLYFAQNDPLDSRFAHNFIVLAPSGLKSSIVPSLKNIQDFDPSWIIPEPTASQLKRLIQFEILDEQKSASKSNRIKNPNAQKINTHQPIDELMGLVAITNAEKVILDRYDEYQDWALLSKDELKQYEVANELREIIGQIPGLAIYIDEVHHAADGEIKLRKVVTGWTEKNSFNCVLGFSGTPFLESAERITISDDFSFRSKNLSNVVYYYPLIDGIGNFLKEPTVKYADAESQDIVTLGVKEFLETYQDVEYINGTCPKLAIYCGRIETLEEAIFPLVAEIVGSFGLNPSEAILKYHEGNKNYPKPKDAELFFSSLDTEFSRVRVILLVQIGKEGWDCKSLTGVILPHNGVCPINMVLQTSCRCLRQVSKHGKETALIWMNRANSIILNRQLQKQQNITLQEFNNKRSNDETLIHRFSRMDYLKVPPIDFYQLKVCYETLTIDDARDPSARLTEESVLREKPIRLIHQQDLSGKELKATELFMESSKQISFNWWLHKISKESFELLTVKRLLEYKTQLMSIFSKITEERDGVYYEKENYDHELIRSLIRQAFLPIRDFTSKEETLPYKANLLQIERLTSPVVNCTDYYPSQEEIKDILEWDKSPETPEPSPEIKEHIERLKSLGVDVSSIVPKRDPHPERQITYHYLPYRFDSSLERLFHREILPAINGKNLEVYFNGDDTLTEFKIRCYKKNGGHWEYIGYYYPDFLLIKRDSSGAIRQVAIIETKGEGYAAKFSDKKQFMETEFIKLNNKQFGYNRFEFLYLEDTLTSEERQSKVLKVLGSFFED